MAVNLSPIWGAGAQLLDNSGNVLSGGKIYTYAAGTTTSATTYTSSNGITANSNPIILNSAGRVPYEIWLTDGISYKFVLKDSNDTLIATYDNLSGINSNFIAYTAQQEIQTATAGQTVFDLTTMQYQPGTNNLAVYVDGVNQYGPGAQYAFVETDSDTVTFVSGLHEGASVKFTTASPVASSSTNADNVSFTGIKGQTGAVSDLGTMDGSDWVGFQPNGTGAVSSDYSIQDKLRQTVSVKDFGAVGDGVADDTVKIQSAIDYLDSNNGGTLIFPKGTYGITDTIFVKDNISLQGEGRPEIKAIDSIVGAMIQFGYTTGVVTDPPTNPCLNAELNNFVINADYKVTLKVFSTALQSGVVYVWKNSTYNKITNCEIKSAECCLVEVEDGADFFELSNCQIHDITSTSSATQFQNLVNIDGPTGAVVDNNDIYDLKISGYSPSSWGYALRLHATDSSVVSNNRMDTGFYNILVDGRSNTIVSNRLTNPYNSSIVLYQNDFGCRYNSIVNNFIDNDTTASGTIGFGIRENLSGSSPDSAKVTNNYIAENTIANASSPLTILNTSGSFSIGNTSITGNPDDGTAGYAPTVNFIDNKIRSGTYTPVLSNITNIASSTAYLSQYMMVNDVVTVSGKIDLTPTTTGAFDLRLTIPVSVNNFADDSEGGGTAHDVFDQTAGVFSQGASKTLRINGDFTSALAKSWWFTATYRIV